MEYSKAWNIKGFKSTAPYERILKVVLCPDLQKTKNLSVGMTLLPPGCSSSPHVHEIEEEAWYVISGRGEATVNNETIPIEKDVTIYVPPKSRHQLVNKGDETLKVLWIFSPTGPEKDFVTK